MHQERSATGRPVFPGNRLGLFAACCCFRVLRLPGSGQLGAGSGRFCCTALHTGSGLGRTRSWESSVEGAYLYDSRGWGYIYCSRKARAHCHDAWALESSVHKMGTIPAAAGVRLLAPQKEKRQQSLPAGKLNLCFHGRLLAQVSGPQQGL